MKGRALLARWGLRAKLVLFGTLLTVATVGLSFAALSVEIRRSTRHLLEDQLGRQQRLVLGREKRRLEELVRISSLMSENPTLRAAMETYRSESEGGASDRIDLVATIQSETDKLARGLARDLFVVSDAQGRLLASSDPRRDAGLRGSALPSARIVRRALDGTLPVGDSNVGILSVGDETYQVGCVPILLQGFVIGTLTLGDRLDGAFAASSRDTLGGDVVVTVGERIAGTTLGGPVTGLARDSGPIARLTIAGDEYVAAPLVLGTADDGRPVTIYLLQSLSAALAPSYRSMGAAFILIGALAVLAGAAAAWSISTSILRPLDSFVRYLGRQTEPARRHEAFDAAGAGPEVQLLNDTYSRLIEAVDRHAQEEIGRIERLKESEKLAALGRMLSGAAHEINNPLTGVIGNAQLMLARGAADPYVRDRAERIYREAQRIVALVRNLLKVAHREAAVRGVVDLNRVVRETIELRRHDFVGAGVRIDLDLTDERTRLFGSELELQQVVLNIVNNALDAIKESPRSEALLAVRTRVAGDAVALEIRDNGPGIREPERVFEHFYTTKDVGKGTGLGLSIAHAIVRAHGGSIEAANDPEGGARFTITIPTTASGAPETPAGVTPAPPLKTPARLSGSVLLVDDEPLVLEFEAEILRDLGASVELARNGDEAIAMLERRAFDVVVSDLKMPGGVSGQDVFLWATANRPETARQFVFVTGDTASDATREFLQGAGQRCVLKPFSRDELIAAIREVLDAPPAAG